MPTQPLPAQPSSSPELDRRRILGGAVTITTAAAALAACGSDDTSSPTTAAVTSGASGSSTGAIAKTADIPVGGGIVDKNAKVVVTQPSSDNFKAFSAVCPHQGCLVSDITNNQIICPCHNSVFSATDGSKISGPSPSGLAPKQINVSNGSIVLA